MFQGCGHQLGEALYSSLFYEKRGNPKPSSTLDVLKKLVGFRNDMIGHGATLRDQEYQEIVEQEIQNLEAVFQSLAFLSEWMLFYPYKSDIGQRWMGASEPKPNLPDGLSTVSIANQYFGQYILVNDTSYFSLHPFIIALKCPDCNAHRLCLYDSQQKNYDKRKGIVLLEYVGGHRFDSLEVAPELERHFSPSLIQDAFRSIRTRLLRIEEQILNLSLAGLKCAMCMHQKCTGLEHPNCTGPEHP
jgi:hypothetical protein